MHSIGTTRVTFKSWNTSHICIATNRRLIQGCILAEPETVGSKCVRTDFHVVERWMTIVKVFKNDSLNSTLGDLLKVINVGGPKPCFGNETS